MSQLWGDRHGDRRINWSEHNEQAEGAPLEHQVKSTLLVLPFHGQIGVESVIS